MKEWKRKRKSFKSCLKEKMGVYIAEGKGRQVAIHSLPKRVHVFTANGPSEHEILV